MPGFCILNFEFSVTIFEVKTWILFFWFWIFFQNLRSKVLEFVFLDIGFLYSLFLAPLSYYPNSEYSPRCFPVICINADGNGFFAGEFVRDFIREIKKLPGFTSIELLGCE